MYSIVPIYLSFSWIYWDTAAYTTEVRTGFAAFGLRGAIPNIDQQIAL